MPVLVYGNRSYLPSYYNLLDESQSHSADFFQESLFFCLFVLSYTERNLQILDFDTHKKKDYK